MSQEKSICEEARLPLFPPISADEIASEPTVIESLCMNCHANGTTRLLLTKIPFYKEVVLMSFTCEECGSENNEIQPGGMIADTGIRLTLKVENPEDLNRQVVKSDYAAIKIPELEFEIPSQSQKGEISTVEGIINRSIAGLSQDQAARTNEHPEVAVQIADFIIKLNDLKQLKEPFTLILEDISGDSHISNPSAPQKDPNCTSVSFKRTKEQDHILGVFTKAERGEKDVAEEYTLEEITDGEVLQFPTNCPECSSPCTTNMKLTKIPHFRDTVIMATTCESCGHRTNEIKSAEGIEQQGLRITVSVEDKADFSRDVLKSETCCISVPELELEVGPRALGGRFTTVEGLLAAVRDQLEDQGKMFVDSRDPEDAQRLNSFLGRIDDVLAGKLRVTVVLDDPAGNSYVQALEGEDARLKVEHYERSFEQNEDLGLNDINVDNY